MTTWSVFPNPISSYSVMPAAASYNRSGYAQSAAEDTLIFGRGADLKCIDVYNIAPYDSSDTSICPAYLAVANTAIPFITSTTKGNTLQTINGQSAVLLDVPRNIGAKISSNQAQTVVTITGMDYYRRSLMVEKITIPLNTTTTVYGKKAFWCVFSVTTDRNITAATTISIGTGFKFGLKYRVDSSNYIGAIRFNGDDALNFEGGGTIPANAGTLAIVNSCIKTASTIQASNDGTIPFGDPNFILLAQCAAGSASVSTAGITQNAGAPYEITGLATSPATINYTVQYTITTDLTDFVTVADSTAATATTGDTRGTIDFGSGASFDGSKLVTVMYYVRGADMRLNAALSTVGSDPTNPTLTQPALTLADLIGVDQYAG